MDKPKRYTCLLQVWIEPEVFDALDNAGWEKRLKRPDVVRKALRDWLIADGRLEDDGTEGGGS